MFLIYTSIETARYCASFQKKCGEVPKHIYRESKGMVRDPMADTASGIWRATGPVLMQAQENV